MANIIKGTLTGFDRLHGTELDDAMYGYGGNDVFYGSGGADYISGGADTDTVDYSGAEHGEGYPAIINDLTINGVYVDLTAGRGYWGDARGDTYSSIENVTGSAHNDAIRGNESVNVILGGKGDDLIEGAGGADRLDGGHGSGDILAYAGSSAGVKVDLTANTASGGDAQGDIISGFEGVFGSAFADVVYGNDAANRIYGGNGGSRDHDKLYGRGGDDIVNGGQGNDVIDGGADADTLIGDRGNDRLTGGTGVDTFHFSEEYGGTDIVTDFEAGTDKIVIDIANPQDQTNFQFGGNLSQGQVWIEYVADDGTAGKIIFEGVTSNQEAQALFYSVEFV